MDFDSDSITSQGAPPAARFCAGNPESISQPETGPVSVLIVDDEAILAKILQMSLERDRRFVVDVAFCGREALRMLQNNHYSLIISDVRMAGVNGLDLFAWVQKHQPQLANRFLFITGDTGNVNVAQLNTPVLHKPFKMGDLTSRCAQIIAEAV
jgi:DNA-binding NtrC family response regulator